MSLTLQLLGKQEVQTANSKTYGHIRIKYQGVELSDIQAQIEKGHIEGFRTCLIDWAISKQEVTTIKI